MSAVKYEISKVDSVCYEAVELAEQKKAAAIIVLTHGNEVLRWITKYHAPQPIFVCTDNELIANQLEGYYRACRTVEVSEPLSGTALVERVKQAGFELGEGDVVTVDDWDKDATINTISLYLFCLKQNLVEPWIRYRRYLQCSLFISRRARKSRLFLICSSLYSSPLYCNPISFGMICQKSLRFSPRHTGV